MTPTHSAIRASYATAYTKGRHAAKEHVPATENPFRPGSSEFHAWNDGHYDEQSARTVAIQRHSTLIWGDPDGQVRSNVTSGDMR